MRVYLPCTLPALATAVKLGELGPAPLTGYAVTPALTEAARASLRMLAADRADGVQAPARRVVIAAEVPESAARAGADLEERARVRLAQAVPLTKVAAVHIDDVEATADVEAALAALPAADEGDDDARFTVDGAEAHELMWYATQEIPDLLRS